jgi:uncharacterized membrane protein YcgQ (UPF0703/DUF1980 family)
MTKTTVNAKKVQVTPTVEEEESQLQEADEAENQSPTEEDLEYQAFMDSISEESEGTVSNNEDTTKESKDYGDPDQYGRVGYQFDLEADKQQYDGKPDIVVGDNLYSTQINDWYTNFEQYEGKVVEIEGYYIDDYAPYTFVGRYGPSCPYCNGGYVSFEFYTLDDLSQLRSGTDWIKVIGILRQGEDQNGSFYYIEALSWDKMDKVGKDTVTN